MLLRAVAPFLGLVLLQGCASSSVQTTGYVAADGRAFWHRPKYVGQEQGTGVSLVAEPEVDLKTESKTHSIAIRPFYRLDPNDEKRSHADVRQASYKLSLEHFELSAGAGIFTWGVLESYRPTDILNQTDFVENVDGTAKLGQPYASVGWIGESASLRLYYLPYFRERTFQGVRGRLRFPTVIDTDDPLFGSRFKQWQPSGAARFTLNVGDFDFGAGLFTGLSREPRFVAELTSGQLVPQYDLIHQGSVDAQWTVGPFVLKAEGFVRLWSPKLRAFGGGGAGVDYTLFKIVGDADLSFAGEYLFDTRPFDAPPTFFNHDGFFGLRLAMNDPSSTEILAGAIADVVDGSTFARVGGSRRFGEHWKAFLGANVFLGPSGKLESSFLKDNYAQCRVAYFF